MGEDKNGAFGQVTQDRTQVSATKVKDALTSEWSRPCLYPSQSLLVHTWREEKKLWAESRENASGSSFQSIPHVEIVARIEKGNLFDLLPLVEYIMAYRQKKQHQFALTKTKKHHYNRPTVNYFHIETMVSNIFKKNCLLSAGHCKYFWQV